MRDLFKFLQENPKKFVLIYLVITKMKEIKEPISIREATINLLPHIFQLPKDLYMTAMLKESFQAATEVLAFVGNILFS